MNALSTKLIVQVLQLFQECGVTLVDSPADEAMEVQTGYFSQDEKIADETTN